MTVLVDDPLIAAMSISRLLPLHKSSQRLRELYPESPRVYGVAVMADVVRRRWWPLASALGGHGAPAACGEEPLARGVERIDLATAHTGRLRAMYEAAAIEMENRSAAAQLAATLAHAVIGRVVALVVLEGRAWDPGLENLWVHVDSDGAIDWAGVVDPTLRVLPDDPCVQRDGVVQLPSEAALITWTAHRCHRALQPLFAELHRLSAGAVSIAAMWRVVGSAVISAAAQVPLLAGSSEMAAMRRGQAVLDALVGFGLPVRGTRMVGGREGLLN